MGKRILIIEDSKTSQAAVRYTLEKNGYDVESADNGTLAIDKLTEIIKTKNETIDLIICDINMPSMDGLSFLKTIRQDGALKYLPVIILSTESQQAMIDEGRQLGASAWMVKPFMQEQLTTLVDKFIKES